MQCSPFGVLIETTTSIRASLGGKNTLRDVCMIVILKIIALQLTSKAVIF